METLPSMSAGFMQAEHYMQHWFLPPARVQLQASATRGWKKLWRAHSFPMPPSFLTLFLKGVNTRCAVVAPCRAAGDLTHLLCSLCPNGGIRAAAASVQVSDNEANLVSASHIKHCKKKKKTSSTTWKLRKRNVFPLLLLFILNFNRNWDCLNAPHINAIFKTWCDFS